METSIRQPRAFGRRPLAGLGRLTVAALVGVALVLGYLQTLVDFPAIIIFAIIPLAVAGLIALGWRWSPALGAIVALALLALIGMPLTETLMHPSVGGPLFAVAAMIVPLLLISVVAGIGATLQNYRYAASERRTPRGLLGALLLVAGLVAGALLVAAAPQPGIAAGISAADLAKLPLLKGEHFEFNQKELRVKAGQTVTLRLENSDPDAHYLDIDELDVHAPIAPGKTSIAIFTPATPGTYLFYCHPHADKASGQGMVGTLVVEP